MTIEKVKEYLQQAYKIDRRINVTLEKSKSLREGLYGRSSQSDSSVINQSGSSDRLGATIAKVIDYERKADELIDRLVDVKLEIESVIQQVEDPLEREVLERRYLLFQKWDSKFDERTGEYIKGIPEIMDYSKRHILRFHWLGLKRLSQKNIKMSPNVIECH